MEKANVLQLKDFLRKVEENESKKVKATHIEVKGFGLIEFVRPREDVLSTYMDNLVKGIDISTEKTYEEHESEDETMDAGDTKTVLKIEKENQKINLKAITEASEEFVYKCCPLLQNKEIRDKYPKMIPFKIPTEIFGANVVIDLATQLNDIFAGTINKTKVIEEVKN